MIIHTMKSTLPGAKAERFFDFMVNVSRDALNDSQYH